jgi:hypothetical protein
MLLSKFTTVVSIVLLLAFVGTGAAVLTFDTSAAPSPVSVAPPVEDRVAVKSSPTAAANAEAQATDEPAAGNTFPIGWGGGGGDHYEISVDRTVRHGGKASGSIWSIVMEPDWYGALAQAFKANQYKGKRLRITAYVKCKDVENAAGLWMIIEGFDGKGNYSVSRDLMRMPVKGTADWKQLEVVLDVPREGAAQIRFGVMLAGKGRVWVDDFQFEVVGNDVKTTGSTVETGKASAGMGAIERFPKEPTNLDFEKLTPESEIQSLIDPTPQPTCLCIPRRMVPASIMAITTTESRA